MLQLKLGGTPTVLRGVVLLPRPEVSPFEVNTQSTHGVKNEEFKLGCIVVFATSSKQDSRVNRCLTKKTCQMCSLPVRGLPKTLIRLRINVESRKPLCSTCWDLFAPNRKRNLHPHSNHLLISFNNITSQAPARPTHQKKTSPWHRMGQSNS